MSLRDFNPADDRIIPLHNQPIGNGSGLGTFHTVHPEDTGSINTSKIVGALAVALMVGAAGVGLYLHSGPSPQSKPVVTASNQPAPPPAAAAPTATTSAASPPDAPAAATTNNNPAPVPMKAASASRSHIAAGRSRDAGVASTRTAADSNQTRQVPVQPAIIPPAVTPMPAAPTPSPSDVANSNSQSSVTVPSDATTASDIPAPQNQPDNAAPPAQPQPSPAGQAPQQ